MQFVNLTRSIGIGANSYFLQAGKHSVIFDAGLHPKQEGWAATPDFSALEEHLPNAVVVTHAHQDHVGSLPVLTRRYQDTPVFMSPETHRIADVMLHNSVNVMMRQREDAGVADYPLFTHRGVELSRSNWQKRAVGQPFTLDGERARQNWKSEPTLEFFDAGHILGSVGVQLRWEGRSIFYTGDVHFDNQSLMQQARFPTEGVDVLIMETTRGDSPLPEGYSRATEKEKLAEIIRTAFADEVSVTIPVFALGKTQELLAMLWELRLADAIPSTPIYIGGLSTKVTEIYDAFCNVPGRGHPDLQLLHEVAPYVVSGREIDTLRPRKRCIFALSSGMMTENTLSSIFVRRILEDARQHLVFVGYSDPKSPAGVLRQAAPGSEVSLDPKLPTLRKNCHLHELNFSAHSPRERLLEYAVRLNPSVVVLVHGDPAALEWFRLELNRRLPHSRVVIPAPGVRIDL